MAKQIFLTGVVSEWMAEEFRYELQNTSEKVVDIFISSWGGDVNKGFEIANLIQGMQGKEIHTHNLSHADSIATVLLLSAKKENRHIVDSSTFFVHEPRFIIFDEVTKGDADKMAAELDMQTNRIADFYVKNIEGLEFEEAKSLMSGETNLNASSMLQLGVVSEVLPNFEIAAQKNRISNINTKKMGLFNSKKPINTVALKDGSTLVHEGELKEGVEVQKAGEEVGFKLEGEHIDNEDNKIIVDADNKVTSIEVKEPVAEGDEVVIEAVSDMLVELEARLDAKIEAIRKVGSKAKITKTPTTSAAPELPLSTQAEARAAYNARIKAKVEAKKQEGKTI